MIKRKQANRLGYSGPDEVKSHPWIRDFPWDKLLKRELLSPFIPDVYRPILMKGAKENFDKRHINKPEEQSDVNPIILRRNSIQSNL